MLDCEILIIPRVVGHIIMRWSGALGTVARYITALVEDRLRDRIMTGYTETKKV